ncbi:MAG: hypothetical protein Q4P26_02845 [Lachnospiraceae bacterium]|nr:hypothetical protein [Lachnospiraceae bacterium]
MQIIFASVFLIPLISLLILLFMGGCTLLAVLLENEEKEQQKIKQKNRY